MHAIKGGWVGQTFALAKCNDSGGRKSRIRRSKEERKSMVELFIKKYQNSNNGNFPSLNLTHKEVGGSFYTVREIVREIIQENRVLGPAKLTPEEQNAERFLEQYPLGSISTVPHLVSSNETHIITHIVPNDHQDTSEEQVLDSSGRCPGPEHQIFDEEDIVNASIQAAEGKEESDEPIYTVLQVKQSLEGEKDVEKELEASEAKLTYITADVVVETFPLRHVSKTINGLDGKSGEPRDLIGTLEEQETENMELEAGNNNTVPGRINFLENSANLVGEKADSNLAGPLLERNCVLVDDKAMVTPGDPSLESPNGSTTKESIVLDVNDDTYLEVKDNSPAGNPPMDAPNGILPENIKSTDSSSSHRQSIPEEAIVNKNKPDIQQGGSSQRGSNPTLDRINLESWEGTSEKSAGPETNPLLALFKAFVAAFVKFWSE